MKTIGAGGPWLLTSDAMKVSYLLQCEIRIPKSVTAIPTLTQVHWIQKTSNDFDIA